MSKICRNCFSSNQALVHGDELIRADALAAFLRLQQSGHQPAMCENTDGRYQVCYEEKRKLNSSARD